MLATPLFTEKDAAIVIYQLLQCIAYCNGHNIVHRDLKPENVMLEESQSFDHIKVIDFGTAVEVGKNRYMRKIMGTRAYIAPEVYGKDYGAQCDIWSIGVIIYTLIIGRPPFETKSRKETYKKIKTVSYAFPKNAKISESAKDLIR